MTIKKLPRYAQETPRSRLVEILCRGKCNCGRYAQIADTPDSWGGTVIDTSGHAECLFCGYIATDYSNWKRI